MDFEKLKEYELNFLKEIETNAVITDLKFISNILEYGYFKIHPLKNEFVTLSGSRYAFDSELLMEHPLDIINGLKYNQRKNNEIMLIEKGK